MTNNIDRLIVQVGVAPASLSTQGRFNSVYISTKKVEQLVDAIDGRTNASTTLCFVLLLRENFRACTTIA